MIFNKKYFLMFLSLIGIQLTFGTALSHAVCDNEISRAYQVNKQISPSYWFHWVTDEAKATASYSELNLDTSTLQGFKNNLFTSAKYVGVLPKDSSKSCVQMHSAIAGEVSSNIQSIRRGDNNGYYMGLDGDIALICVSQYLASNNCDFANLDKGGSNQQNNSSSSASSSQANKKANRQATASQSNQGNSENQSSSSNSTNQSNQQISSSSTNSSSGSNMRPEQAELVNGAAQTYATKTAAFEESHKGLKRTHNKEDEASRCLKMDGRQITNTCDFRVEYVFCAYNPDQNAFKAAFEMAAAFDCERRQMGMQGIRAKGKSAGTFTADAVYVFGCKDPSLPAGVTYERGRGLSGWCE